MTDGRGPMVERLQGLYRARMRRTFARRKRPWTLRIAMWSGPRNLSTAMMRSFGNRADTFVSDEPYYGAFLETSGTPHPMRDEVIAAMDCDWRSSTRTLAGQSPTARPLVPEAYVAPHGRPGRL